MKQSHIFLSELCNSSVDKVSCACTECQSLHDSTNPQKALYSAYTINMIYTELLHCTEVTALWY